jgi:hypothetical protein
MNTPDNLSTDEIAVMGLLFKFLKSFAVYLAGTVGVVTILLASPFFPKTVSLTAENPLFVVDGKKFGKSILDRVASGNVSTSTVEKLSEALGSKSQPINLGENGADFVFFREWYHRTRPKLYPEPKTLKEQEWQVLWDRGVLAQRKQFLGYTDAEAKFEFGKSSKIGENMQPLETLTGDPALIHSELQMRSLFKIEDIGTGKEYKIYASDPFYSVAEKLTAKEKFQVYDALAFSSRSYSWFVLQNGGGEDEYDVRVVANVNSNDVNTEILSSFGITIEQALRDSVRFRVGNLAPGPTRYKFIVIQGSPQPIEKENVRLDQKPFVEQLANHWFLLLVVPTCVALLETNFERLKAKRSRDE